MGLDGLVYPCRKIISDDGVPPTLKTAVEQLVMRQRKPRCDPGTFLTSTTLKPSSLVAGYQVVTQRVRAYLGKKNNNMYFN